MMKEADISEEMYSEIDNNLIEQVGCFASKNVDEGGNLHYFQVEVSKMFKYLDNNSRRFF